MARSRTYSFGPSVTWNFLNYGRITNQVRTQDAAFEEALITYQNTVLVAQQEVENALVGFRKQQERAKSLSEAVRAAQHSLQLAIAQYRAGVADFTTVLVAEQQLLAQQDSLAVTAGAIPSNLVAVYRALGGGWQIREDQGFVPPQTIQAMASRTDWGRLLTYKVGVPPIPVPRPERPRLPEW
jgi:outer membrane protein TolC